MKPRLRVLMALVSIVSAIGISTAWAAPADALLPVPQRSQFDGTVWAETDCGPTSIAMVMQAFGQNVPTEDLRYRANQLLGIANPNTGTRVQDLAEVVREHGLSVTGPYSSPGVFRQWTPEEVRAELQEGHPVVAQTYYPLLPNHMNRPVATDHYIVLVGCSGDNFVFNDPADYWGPGYRQTMTTAQLLRAWGASSVPFGGFSVGPGSSDHSLLPSAPAVASAPTGSSAPTNQGDGAALSADAPAKATTSVPDRRTSQDAVAAGAAAAATPQSGQPGALKASATAVSTPTNKQVGDSKPAAASDSAAAKDQGKARDSAAPIVSTPLPNLSEFARQLKDNLSEAAK